LKTTKLKKENEDLVKFKQLYESNQKNLSQK